MAQKIVNGNRILLDLTRNDPPWISLIITAGFPTCVMIGLYFVIDFEIFYLIGLLLFLVVGFLNYYIVESREVPLKIHMSEGGIYFLTKKGQKRQYTWAEITNISEVTRSIRGKQRLEIYFSDGSEPLKLYAFAMYLPDRRFSDRLRVTGQTWDRPVKQARIVLEKFVSNWANEN